MARRQGLADQGPVCQLEAIFPHLAKILAAAADPDGVLIYLDRFLQVSAQLPDLFCRFSDNPRSLEILTTIFASSQFLSEILLRNPEYFEEIIDTKRLAQPVLAYLVRKACFPSIWRPVKPQFNAAPAPQEK